MCFSWDQAPETVPQIPEHAVAVKDDASGDRSHDLLRHSVHPHLLVVYWLEELLRACK